MKILIQGGGLCGLGTAAHLQQAGHEVVIVEKYKTWNDPVGFGINLWDIALKALVRIGVYDAVIKDAYSVPYIRCVDHAGAEIMRTDWTDVLPHARPHTIERRFLHAALRERCAAMKLHLGVTVESLDEHAGGVDAHLSNGVTERVDLVVGADGIHSAIRKQCFQADEPTYYGWKHWLFFIPDGVKVPEGFNQIWGPNCFFFTFPGRYRSVGWCTMIAPPDAEDPVEGRIERMKERFAFMEYLVPDILAAMKDPKDMFFGNVATVNMTSWRKGRVVLAGDAEHAPTPLMGMGASMAMEDGEVLAEQLALVPALGLDAALAGYEVRRRERIHRMRKASKLLWKLIVMPNPLLVTVRNNAARFIAKGIIHQTFGTVLKGEG
jgi:2-polyprenyl-6-methoxyphenol hydroxylase-like FAD-dependent oxidoreductase